jgi:hypothetical protein
LSNLNAFDFLALGSDEFIVSYHRIPLYGARKLVQDARKSVFKYTTVIRCNYKDYFEVTLPDSKKTIRGPLAKVQAHIPEKARKALGV